MSDNREDLTQSLYEKATQEHNQFLTEIEKLTPREVIANAYEIVTKADLLMMLEDPDFLTLPQLIYLESLEAPLSTVYIQWINVEDSRMEELRSCTEHFVENELSQIATKQYENPQIPRYDKGYADARELGETAQYHASHKRDIACLQTFNTKVHDAYEGRAVAQFVEGWTNEFGKERCRFVLGYSIHAADYDGRYSMQSKRAAKETDYTELDSNDYHSASYRTNVHPCIINATFERLIEGKQKSKDMER